MNISKLVVDAASELIILLAAHLLKSAHRIRMFDIASDSLDYVPKWKLSIKNNLILFSDLYLRKDS